MPEVTIGIPPFVAKFSKDELDGYAKSLGKITNPLSKVNSFKKLQGQYSKSEAIGILDILYQEYFDRKVDESGVNTYSPYIHDFGFMGIVWITQQLIQSDEMNRKTNEDLQYLYQTYLNRDIDPDGKNFYEKWIRYFGKQGKCYVENCIKNSVEYKGKG